MARGQSGTVGQRPQQRQPHRAGGVGCDLGFGGCIVRRRHPENREQEPGIVEARGGPVVRGAVDVHQRGIHTRGFDVPVRPGSSPQWEGEAEWTLLSLFESACDGDELAHGPELVVVTVQTGA
ncbi:Uncharacterised protein [Mycobacteroides abscessus subsp. abscessus]|nr:Uncharacterised protein [Mycobacteroides abscessus subsp. abscessus]